EKERTHQLLLNILPQETAAELMRRGRVRPRKHDEVTILFMDIVGFTQLTEQIEAEDLVEELDYYYKVFDTIFGKHGVEKIKTIGDAYLAVCGVPAAKPDHARNMIVAAMEVVSFLKAEDRQRRRSGRPSFQVRIGVHSGSVITGVVGHTKFAYDVWGDDVNVAARIESTGQPGQINVSESTYLLTRDQFDYTYRGKIEAKHKGEMDMYFLQLPG
ncbi:MAG: adenylate/guanylate cyclase domain-containing protein, partial [Lewinella sp.]